MKRLLSDPDFRRTLAWNFDGIYRLTEETVAGDAQYNGGVNYGLDPVGNRLSQSSSLHGISSTGFSYNADDQILGETYDSNGNTTATGGKTFTYDSENHLVSMNGGAVTMIYDGDGNRVMKTANGSTTKYLVDDLNPTGYSQVVEETVNGAAQREYTYGLQRIDEDQIVNSAWTPSFYGYDGFGTVRQLTSLTGAVTDTFEYDAFGNEITRTGTTPNNYLYRGEQYDPDLGLYYLRARYYNPLTGRFMSRDPEDGNPKIPATLHRYLYTGADPVDGVDPTGRATVDKPTWGNAIGEYTGLIQNLSIRAWIFTQVTVPVYLDTPQGRAAVLAALNALAGGAAFACEIESYFDSSVNCDSLESPAPDSPGDTGHPIIP